MKFLFLFILALFPIELWATDCPDYNALSIKDHFVVKVPADFGHVGTKPCRVSTPELVGNPLEVVGCPDPKKFHGEFFVRAPKGFEHECITNPDGIMRVYGDDFDFFKVKLANVPIPEPKPLDCVDDPQEILDREFEAGMSSLVSIIASDDGTRNGFKPVGHLEKFTRCLLTGYETRQENYVTKYADMIENASEAFGVPVALLTCSCGRESMFNPVAKSHTGVRGVCQNTGASLTDVAKWVNKEGSVVNQKWKKFLELLGDKIEHKSCLKARLNQATIEHCPSLGFGAAAIYLSYIYKEASGEESIGNASWDNKDITSLITFAATNNVGPARLKALRGKSKHQYARALLNETCKKDGYNKFKEVKEHMLAIRSCLMEDTWLDHQGKPLGGECKRLNYKDSVAKQKEARAKFAASLPGSCQ